MRLLTAQPLPTTQEVAEILKREFSGDYSYQLFGLGKDKSILVGKSAFVGAQISIRENEITIQGAPPSMLAWLLSFLGWTELSFIPIIFLGMPWSLNAKWKALEKEIGVFFRHKYQ